MLTASSRHTVAALLVLAELPRGAFLGARDLAAKVGAPSNYLGKLLQTLCQRGLLISQRGKRGGFALSRKPSRITLYHIVEPIEDLKRWGSCLLENRACSSRNPCAVHKRWAPLREAYLSFLRETTLADLLKGERKDKTPRSKRQK